MRFTGTASYKSGLFMHREPIHTAARIIHVEPAELTEDNEALYDRIIREPVSPAPRVMARRVSDGASAVGRARPAAKKSRRTELVAAGD